MTDREYATIDEYLAGFREPVRSKLEALRRVVRQNAPGAVEKISYKMPTFYLNGNLVHFAAYAGHIGFYPTPSGIAEFEEELSHYKHAKGSVQFPLDEPLPLDLIARMVRFRVEENTKKRKK